MMPKFLVASLVAALAGAAPPPDDGKIHACKDADGNVVYLGEPCPETPPAAPKTAAAKPAPATKPVVIPKPASPPKAKAIPRSKPAPPVTTHGSAPELVLRTFVSAVTAGDRSAALSCLTSSALIELGPDAESLPMDELRKTVSSFTGYVDEGAVGPFWSIRALRAGMRPKWIFLEETARGDWKISAF